MVQEMNIESLASAVEAVLFATGEAMGLARLAGVLGVSEAKVEKAILHLSARLSESGSALTLKRTAGGWRLLTLPTYHEYIERAKKSRKQSLSPSALDTLAIIAYNQPVRRSEVEAIRGVSCGETIRGLMEAGLVRVVGRDKKRGRAMLYGTTQKFLEVFGIKSLEELPDVSSIRLERE